MSIEDYKLYLKAATLYILVRYKAIQNRIFGIYTSRHQHYMVNEIKAMKELEKFSFSMQPNAKIS